MDLALDGKVALVTGASDGLGAAIARRLDLENCRLVLVSRSQEKLDSLKGKLRGRYAAEALAISCDVRSTAEIQATLEKTLAYHERVQILVNNAGGPVSGALKPFDELCDDDFIESYSFNVMSVIRFVRGVLPGMRQARWGRVVSISSESAVQPDPTGADYNSAKAALNTLSKTLSKAYGAEGVLFNTVSPAFTMTPLLEQGVARLAAARGVAFEEALQTMLSSFRPNIVLKRPGVPEEVAAAVAFLVSDAASFITGTNLRADGGSIASVSN